MLHVSPSCGGLNVKSPTWDDRAGQVASAHRLDYIYQGGVFAKHCPSILWRANPSPWWRPTKRVKNEPGSARNGAGFSLFLSSGQSPAIPTICVKSRVTTEQRAKKTYRIAPLQRNASDVKERKYFVNCSASSVLQ